MLGPAGKGTSERIGPRPRFLPYWRTMIVSHKHKFIFLKTRKTAGTSVEAALTAICAPGDIVTPISPADEPLRAGTIGPSNHRGNFNPLPELTAPGVDITRTIRDAIRGRRFFNHMTAVQARNRLPRRVWDSYFKFTVERNPWDKTVSLFHWRNRGRDVGLTWEEFIENWPLQSDWRIYTLGGELAVDFVVRYESLADDLKSAMQQVGVSDDFELPKAKGGHRKDPRSYRQYYSDAQRDRVAQHFAREIDQFNYSF